MTLSDELQNVLHRALVGAREAGHPILTPEHLALELILEQEIATYLERCGTDLVAVESRLRAYLGKIESSAGDELETIPSATFQRIVGDAFEHTRSERRKYVMLRDIFLAVIDERSCVASSAILEATRDPQMFEELRYEF
jgi:ATP-dependent Clp protease ATP-binding subunit ClpA